MKCKYLKKINLTDLLRFSKRFCIEIEEILVDNQVDSYAIYFGDCSAVLINNMIESVIFPIFLVRHDFLVDQNFLYFIKLRC